MSALWAAVGIPVGAACGWWLAGPVWRTPWGDPEQSTRAADVVAHLRRRTAPPDVERGRVPAARRLLLAAVTALLFCLVLARFGASWTAPAYLLLTAMSVLLTTIDLLYQRLPNALLIAGALATLPLLTLAAVVGGDGPALGRAAAGAAVLFGVYLVLALIAPAGLGMGDVKLAGILGLFLAFLGWRTLVLGAAGGFALAALVGLALLIARRVHTKSQLPFGPFMMSAALAAVLLRLG